MRFNEAAAYHCGKRRRRSGSNPERLASMRPQHITAENEDGPQLGGRDAVSFNEAAAYHCGKHALTPRMRSSIASLQ